MKHSRPRNSGSSLGTRPGADCDLDCDLDCVLDRVTETRRSSATPERIFFPTPARARLQILLHQLLQRRRIVLERRFLQLLREIRGEPVLQVHRRRVLVGVAPVVVGALTLRLRSSVAHALRQTRSGVDLQHLGGAVDHLARGVR
jgi:hypothetical protein